MKTFSAHYLKSARLHKLLCGLFILFLLPLMAGAQCIPTTSTGFQENLLQATFHTILYQTPNGYAASGEGTAINGSDQPNIQEINNANGYTGIPANTNLVWGTLGGHAQLIFLGDDNIIYAGGIQGRVLNNTLTPSNAYGATSLPVPPGVDHSDVIRFQASNEVIILMTDQGQIYTSGATCGNIATPCTNLNWTSISLPAGVSPVKIDLSAKTLFMYGSDGNFYTRGTRVFSGNGTNWFSNAGTWVQMVAPPMSNGSVPVQIELANHEDEGEVSYLVLDIDGTIHSMGNAPVVANNSNSSFSWVKVGENCPGGELTGVVFISASDNDDRHVGAGAILDDGTIRLWGVDDNNMLAGAGSECPSEICTADGTVMPSVVYLENGTHLTPTIGEGGMLCNVGHNSDGGFGDGTEDDRECYECYELPPLPELCINGDCGLDTTVQVTICQGDTYFEQLSEYTSTGTYTDLYQSSLGCDSTVTTELTVLAVIEALNVVSVCAGGSYFEGSSEYTAAGTYTDTYQTLAGCDSIVTTELSILDVLEALNVVSICEGGSYFEGSSEYTAAGTYTDTYQTLAGCDSIVTTELSINSIIETTNTILLCEGESYFEGGSEYDQTGIFTDTYQTALGCDSIVTTDLTVNPISASTNTVTICDGESYFEQLSEYTASGVYTDIYQNIIGCDSIVTTDLTVNAAPQTTVEVSICDGDTYFEQSSEYTITGTYTDNYQTVLGCDSTVTTILAVNAVEATTNEVSICEGEIYSEQNSMYDQSGTYTDTYQTILGCDSVVTTVLIVNSVFEQSIQVSICEGESYFEGASEYTQSGTYTDIYQTTFGCDSIIITELTVNLNPSTTNEVVICEGEEYIEQLSIYNQAGIYTDVYQSVLGCDSTVTTVLSVNPIATTSVDRFICAGDVYNEQNSAYTESGIYTDVYQTVLGCDSIVTTNLTVYPAIIVDAGPDMRGCPGEEYILTANATGGSSDTYIFTWQALGEGQSHTVIPLQDTYYTVFASDEFGCGSLPDNCLISVINMDDDILNVELSDGPYCQGSTAELQAHHEGPQEEYFYEWNAPFGSDLGPFDVYAVTDTWYILTVSDICNNSIQDSVFLDVIPLPNVQIAPVPGVGCAPHEVYFFDEGHHLPGMTFFWEFGDGTTSTEEEPIYTYTEFGEFVYTLTITNADGCSASNENIGQIDVVGSPQAGISASTFILDNVNSIVHFESTSSADAVAWDWDFSDGTAGSDLEDPSHDFEEIGEYTVTLIAENEYGCRDTTFTEIYVVPLHELIIPNAFTPNPNGGGGGMFDINSIENDVFFPWTDHVSEFEMLIYSRWGELIFQSNDINIGWDGYYKGQMSQQDVYVYRINITYEDGLEVERVGNLSLYK